MPRLRQSLELVTANRPHACQTEPSKPKYPSYAGLEIRVGSYHSQIRKMCSSIKVTVCDRVLTGISLMKSNIILEADEEPFFPVRVNLTNLLLTDVKVRFPRSVST